MTGRAPSFKGLVRRYFVPTALILVLFVLLGALSSIVIVRQTGSINTTPPLFYARLIDHLSDGDRIDTVRDLLTLNSPERPIHMSLINEKGEVVFPDGAKRDAAFDQVERDHHLPQTLYASYAFVESQFFIQLRPHEWIICLAGDGPEKLWLHLAFPRPAELSPARAVSIVLTCLGLSVFLGITFALSLLFRTLRTNIELADSVINEIEKGNLKARFPISRMDEIGQTMTRFNHMADEIEHLVERMKTVEASRASLLQELAHDLRTPVASLKNLIETVATKDASLKPALRIELLELAINECDYFERLVEDLLIIAQVNDPRYQPGHTVIRLGEMATDEAEAMSATNDDIKLKLDIPDEPLGLVVGDEHLLRRLLRNGLQNAFSFAKSEVVIRLRVGKDECVLSILDDGPGFSDEALRSYGQRRITRVVGPRTEGRLSIGLGSVIMKAVASAHRGSVQAANRLPTSSEGLARGSEITITFPLIVAPSTTSHANS